MGQKLRRFLSVLLPLVALFFASSVYALDVPELTGRVVDNAKILSAEDAARISALLEAHERSTGQQFAVLTVPSLEGQAIEQFSIRVVDAWKLGKKGKDDGLLLLVAPNDRKVRIDTGYGLEGSVTDAQSSRIIRDVISPDFRNGDYARGIDNGLKALMMVSSGKVPDVAGPAGNEGQDRPAQRGLPLGLVLFLILFVSPFLLPLLFGRGRRGGGFYGGPFGGGFGGGGFGGGGFGGGGGGGGFGGGGGGFGGGGSSGSW
jgi:uncharacterized protein